MRRLLLPLIVVPALAGMLLWSACDRPTPPQVHATPPSEASAAHNISQDKQRQLAFLQKIRDADPKGETIQRALLNEDHELGLILGRGVEMEKIPALMGGMLTQMAKEFPGEDLTIIAYAPSSPPRKIGTARLNAQSRDMTYTPAG